MVGPQWCVQLIVRSDACQIRRLADLIQRLRQPITPQDPRPLRGLISGDLAAGRAGAAVTSAGAASAHPLPAAAAPATRRIAYAKLRPPSAAARSAVRNWSSSF